MGDPLFAKYGKKAAAGEALFRQGENGSEMYVVRSGSVRIYVENSSGEKTLAILGPGEFVGEMSLLNDRPRTATAVVNEDAELLVIGAKVLEEMIVSNTEIALRLIRKLARRLEATDSLVEVLLLRDPKERVIENLKRLARLHGWAEGSPISLSADVEGVAEQVGLTVAEVADVISRMVHAGALAEEGGIWTIEDPSKLGDFLSFLQLKGRYT